MRRLIALLVLTVAPAVHAQGEDRARELFLEGVDLTEWGQFEEALGAFEKSSAILARAKTTYQIATCERLLGRYTRARKHYRDALAANAGGEIPDDVVQSTTTILAELEKRIARIELDVRPEHASVAVDGRPLENAGLRDGKSFFVAGVLAQGPGRWTPVGPFVIEVDPGAHVVTVTEQGHNEAAQGVAVESGKTRAITITLTRSVAPVFDTEVDPLRVRKRTMGWSFGAAGLALIATGAYFGVRAVRLDHDVVCPNGFCTDDDLETRDRARTSARIADFTLGFGLVSTAIGGWLLYSSREPVKRTFAIAPHGSGIAISAVW